MIERLYQFLEMSIDVRKPHYYTTVLSNLAVAIKGDKSPYDGDLVYWSSRLGRHPELSKTKATLLKKQKGKCAYCGLYFLDRDLSTIEVDHIIPKSLGGKDSYENLQLLHGHCHDKKTKSDGSQTKGLLTKLERKYSKQGKPKTEYKAKELSEEQCAEILCLRDRIKSVAYKWKYLEKGYITQDELEMFTKWVEKPVIDEKNKPIPTPDEYWEKGWRVLLRLEKNDSEFIARLVRVPEDSSNSCMTS